MGYRESGRELAKRSAVLLLAVTAIGAVAGGSAAGVVSPPGNAPAPKPGGEEPIAAPRSALQVTAACEPRFGTFGVGRWPSGCWRPYADTSPWNQPLPPNPLIHPDSERVVARTVSFGPVSGPTLGIADTVYDYSHPTYYSQPTDPVFTLNATKDWGRNPLERMRIRIPDAARPAGSWKVRSGRNDHGGDGHMTIVDQSTGWEYDLWQVRSKPSGGGRLDFSWGGRTRIDGDGLGSGAVAAEYGNLAGIIRAEEMERGVIDHALFMIVPCTSGGNVYPATGGGGRSCSEIEASTLHAPTTGMRFQLDLTDAQIDALAVPNWRKTILRALAKYGAYVGDTGGGRGFGFGFESGSTYTSFGHPDKFVEFAKSVGISGVSGVYKLEINDGVDWASHLRVVDPCVAQGTCPVSQDLGSAPTRATGRTESSGPTDTQRIQRRRLLVLRRQALRLTRAGFAPVRVSCRGAACRGILSLSRRVPQAGGARARRITLGFRRFSIRANRRGVVRVPVMPRQRRLIARRGKVHALATAVLRLDVRSTATVVLAARQAAAR